MTVDLGGTRRPIFGTGESVSVAAKIHVMKATRKETDAVL